MIDGGVVRIARAGCRSAELIAAAQAGYVAARCSQIFFCYPRRIEDYGFGKGYQHVYETFLPLLSDLDQHVRAGRNVVLILHDCTATVPNPKGEDCIRWEPRLQSPSSGKASTRLRVREWLDHLLYVGCDVEATRSGKAQGHGTRTVWP